ncbi:hypothetical protein P7C70_g1186, partial [Phenoliferia sp. Uapishka_3]
MLSATQTIVRNDRTQRRRRRRGGAHEVSYAFFTAFEQRDESSISTSATTWWFDVEVTVCTSNRTGSNPSQPGKEPNCQSRHQTLRGFWYRIQRHTQAQHSRRGFQHAGPSVSNSDIFSYPCYSAQSSRRVAGGTLITPTDPTNKKLGSNPAREGPNLFNRAINAANSSSAQIRALTIPKIGRSRNTGEATPRTEPHASGSKIAPRPPKDEHLDWEERQRRAAEDEGSAAQARIRREETIQQVPALTIKGKGKAREEEKSFFDPPKLKASGKKASAKAKKGPKVPKALETITIRDSDSDSDEIEDPDEARQPPLPPPKTQSTGSRRKEEAGETSTHFSKGEPESDDPMDLLPSAKFNLTTSRSTSSSRADPVPATSNIKVKKMVEHIEEKNGKNVVTSLKRKVASSIMQASTQLILFSSQQQPPALKVATEGEEFDMPTFGDQSIKKARTGPASSRPSLDKPLMPDDPEPNFTLPLIAYCGGFGSNLTFPPHDGQLEFRLALFSPPGKHYHNDKLILETRRKGYPDSRPTSALVLKCEQLSKLEIPEKVTEDMILAFYFREGDVAKQAVDLLYADATDRCEPSLTVRVKPDTGDDYSDGLKRQMTDLLSHFKLHWKTMKYGALSGAGGQARIQYFDNAFAASKVSSKGAVPSNDVPPLKAEKRATFQTTLTLPAKTSASNASPKSSRTSKVPEAAAQSTRRSNRNSTAAQSQTQESLEPFHPKDNTPTDRVILIWPHEGVGAVSVTHGDKLRLRDEEFLNDTLIELGLKRISEALSAKDPLAAKEVHMFNSFFYKKLSTKKPPSHHEGNWDAYSTVRKWTAKFDIFDKKFVIVPINEHLHWFLAIIINPGAILAAPTKRVTRNSTIAATTDNEDADVDGSHAISQLAIDEDDGKVEQALSADFSASVSRTQGGDLEDKMSVDEDGATTFGAPHETHSDEEDMIIGDSDDEDELKSREKAPGAVEPLLNNPLVDYRSSPESDEPALPPIALPSLAPKPSPPLPLRTRNIIPTPFAPSPKPPQSRAPPQDAESHLVEQLAADEEFAQRLSAAGYDDSKCYIFTFDSLGGKHNAVTKKLKAYLQSEAEDKKGKSSEEISVEENTVMDCAKNQKARTVKASDVAGVAARKQEIRDDWNERAAVVKRVSMREEVDKLSQEWVKFRAPLDARDVADREERKNRKKQEKVGVDKEPAVTEDAREIILKAKEMEERDMEEREQRERHAEAASQRAARAEVEKKRHETAVADLANGRLVQTPLQPPRSKGKGRASETASTSTPRNFQAKTPDELTISDDEDSSHPAHPEHAAPATASDSGSSVILEPSTSTKKSATILPPPNQDPRPRRSRPGSPNPAPPRSATPTAASAVDLTASITISPPSPGSQTSRSVKRDAASISSDGQEMRSAKRSRTTSRDSDARDFCVSVVNIPGARSLARHTYFDKPSLETSAEGSGSTNENGDMIAEAPTKGLDQKSGGHIVIPEISSSSKASKTRKTAAESKDAVLAKGPQDEPVVLD